MVDSPDPKCVPVGTDIFNADTSKMIRGVARDPNVLCNKPGYSLGTLLSDGPEGALKCIANSATGVTQGSTPDAPKSSPTMTGTTTGTTQGSPPDAPPPPTMTGTTTGGSSTNVLGSTSGGGGDRRKQVFGPSDNGRGEVSTGVTPMDSSKSAKYPELLGGGEPRKTTMTDAGIVPTKDIAGGLPSAAGLGADEMSQYFPTSRVPGDMEKIPDPYRVSQSFSAASYSFKTEPVPFLTDFSAFQK